MPAPFLVFRPDGDVRDTQNQYLKAITQAVKNYNLLLPTCANQQKKNQAYLLEGKMVGYLDAIMKNGFAYYLSRPFGGRKERGQDRATAISRLISDVLRHADQFGIKFLHCEDYNNSAKWGYWAERATQHWMDEEELNKLANWFGSKHKRPFSAELADCDNTLEYFKEAQRSQFEVRFEGQNIVYTNGTMLDTTNGTGTWSGLLDSYIYVCSAKTRKIYTAPSKCQELHHSSFLRGAPVIAAGDWIVKNGKLGQINGGSGHYRPAGANINLFLRAFAGSLNPAAWVQPIQKGPIYKIGDYLIKGEKAKEG